MNAANLFFYLFSGVMLASAFLTIAARNPVHSVLFLILAFVNAAGLFLLAGAEFLAMILIVVYVGAVMVLFLFVVMMLDVDFREFKRGMLQLLPIAAIVGLILAIELIMVAGGWTLGAHHTATAIASGSMAPGSMAPGSGAASPATVSNTAAIGAVLYTKYFYFFEGAGFVLLTAMIGSIILTLRHKKNIKRQSVPVQNARQPHETVELKKTPFRTGV